MPHKQKQKQQTQQQQEEDVDESSSLPSACAICNEGGSDPSSTATTNSGEQEFALRCNSCRLWYHPWCLGYQLDVDRSCLVTTAEVDIPIDVSVTGLPLVCQWFCDSCASTVTGVVAATSKRPSGQANKKKRGAVVHSGSAGGDQKKRRAPAGGRYNNDFMRLCELSELSTTIAVVVVLFGR